MTGMPSNKERELKKASRGRLNKQQASIKSGTRLKALQTSEQALSFPTHPILDKAQSNDQFRTHRKANNVTYRRKAWYKRRSGYHERGMRQREGILDN
jgi:hypothetical protein